MELFGLNLGTPFQGATLFAVITAFFTALGIWLKYGPDRKRAANEEKVIDNAEEARRDTVTRAEVHKLKNDIAKCIAGVAAADRKNLALEKLHATSVVASTARRDQMDNMMSLIEMLIAEIERIDTDSIIVPQAKMLAKQMRASAERAAALLQPLIRPIDPNLSDAMNTAEAAVSDARQTVISATATRTEVVKKEEGE